MTITNRFSLLAGFLFGSGLLLATAGCAGDSTAQEPGRSQSASFSPAANRSSNPQSSDHSLYLRGEMNDYGVAQAYRLQPAADGSRCTLAALRADWSPYKFKFADEQWSPGYNYGYAAPPGTLREGSAPVKLNPDSRFEELRLHVSEDGVYRFCLSTKGGSPYASVKKAEGVQMQSLVQAVGAGDGQSSSK